jgi:hypothetical protein
MVVARPLLVPPASPGSNLPTDPVPGGGIGIVELGQLGPEVPVRAADEEDQRHGEQIDSVVTRRPRCCRTPTLISSGGILADIGLAMNRDIARGERWSRHEIRQPGRALAERVIAIWKHSALMISA